MEGVFSLFILLLAFGDSMGQLSIELDTCEVDKCLDIVKEYDIPDFNDFPPSESELNRICPPVVRFGNCMSDLVTECTGETYKELANSDNETVALFMDMFGSIRDLVEDLCDKTSSLRKNYAQGLSCFKEIVEEEGDDCVSLGTYLYEVYKDSLNELMNEGENEEGECMVLGYGMACIAQELRKKCDTTTSDTFLEIIRRFKFIKMSYCSPEDLLTLKTDFSNFLEEQGEKQYFLKSIFDFRKRK